MPRNAERLAACQAEQEREARFMALVEIDDIELGAPQPGKIHAFSIDAPRIGGRNVYDVEFAGWVLGNDQPVLEIEIHRAAWSCARRRSTSSVLTSLAITQSLLDPERADFGPG